ncbi:MAG TPA: hypothetical protein VI731_08190 [Bacteroidia bacterium]|nr:hypothetical protein [Bacteroidia bacterium]
MKNTLLILGAGSTKDFCDIFPVGSELIRDINYHFLTELKFQRVKPENGIYLSPMMNETWRIFSSETNFLNEIKNRIWNIQLEYEFKYIRRNEVIPTSIDRFIQNELERATLDNKAIPIIKYSICYLIKGSEQALSEGSHKLEDNWIKTLVAKLSKYSFVDVSRNLKIINFNYDRVFLKYFSDYAQFAWPEIKNDEIQSFLSKIISPYGTLGSLGELPFCLPNDQTSLMKSTYDRIKLADERNNTIINIDNCEKINELHFIGFGYDPTNLEKINISQFCNARFSGTGYGMNKKIRRSIQKEHGIKIRNLSCNKYINAADL